MSEKMSEEPFSAEELADIRADVSSGDTLTTSGEIDREWDARWLATIAALRSEVAGLKGLLGECRDALIEGQTAWQRATIVGRIDKALGKGE